MRRTAWLLVLAIALSARFVTPASAQPVQTKYEGTLSDYVQALGATWLVSGSWTIELKGTSGRGSFSASLTMVNPATPENPAHTHHVTLTDGEIAFDDDWSDGPQRFTITGAAEITGNGGVAGYSGAPITVMLSGGNGKKYSNVSLTFGDPASGHFGTSALVGTVKQGK